MPPSRKPSARLLRKLLPEPAVQALKRWVDRFAGPEHLHMMREGLDDLPAARLPEGYRMKPPAEDPREEYLRVMRRCLVENAGDAWFRNVFSGDPRYDPADLLIVRRDGEPVAAAAAWHRAWQGRRVGLVHWVGVDPSCRRQGVGRALVLLVLARLREKGFREALLLTEDHRIAALRLYLSLGFRPVMLHGTHRLRWARARRRVARAGRREN